MPIQVEFTAGVVPAYAGVDRTARRSPLRSASCPRVCGGGPIQRAFDLSPDLVVPAYAGVDRQGQASSRSHVQLSPRMRGWTAKPVRDLT